MTVDDDIFYWKIRKVISHEERHDQEYGIPVQHESEGRILLVYAGLCRSGYNGEEAITVTPHLIHTKIKEAIKLGWQYNEPGKTVKLINGELI